MKKLILLAVFSLGAMSFTVMAKKAPCDTVFTVCDEEANNNQEEFDMSNEEAHEWFDKCMSINDC